jgi:peptide chain release factor 1
MDGEVQDIIDACRTHFAAEALKEASRSDSARAAEKRA